MTPEAKRTFELLHELGSGTFGTVYLANLVSGSGFKKQVAIKLLNPRWDDASEWGRRLRDEARLLGQLQHRHIIQVDDLIRLDGRWAVVMEHIPGQDLETVLENLHKQGKRLPWRTTLEIIASVAGALDAAYNGTGSHHDPMRVIHRDIKPGNVRITPQGDIKVLDFGIARASFDGRESATRDMRMGTLGYMAPERFATTDESPAGDVFSMGALLYEMLMGTPSGKAPVMPHDYDQWREALLAEAKRACGDNGDLLSLLADMLIYDAKDRPTAAQVRSTARTLIRDAPGADIVDFAAQAIEVTPPAQDTSPKLVQEDTKSGTFYFEDEGEDEGDAHETLAPVLGSEEDEIEAPSVGARPSSKVWVWVGGLALLALLAFASRWLPSQAPEALAPTLPPPVEIEKPSVAPASIDRPGPDPTEQPDPPFEAPAGQEAPVLPDVQATPTQATASPPPIELAQIEPEQTVTKQVDRAMFRVTGASKTSVVCGSASWQQDGQTTTLKSFPAGLCTVTATIGDETHRGTVTVDSRREVQCSVTNEGLQCQ